MRVLQLLNLHYWRMKYLLLLRNLFTNLNTKKYAIESKMNAIKTRPLHTFVFIINAYGSPIDPFKDLLIKCLLSVG